MIYDQPFLGFSRPSAAVIADRLFVVLNNANQLTLASAGGPAHGISRYAGSAIGDEITADWFGNLLVNVGVGGLNAGDDVMADALGKATTATIGNVVLGKCLQVIGTQAVILFYVPGAQSFKSELETASTDGIVARAGGGQALATQLSTGVNRVATVATAGDSVKLPVSFAGAQVVVINDASNPLQVFGAGTDIINDVASAIGIAQPGPSIDIYVCPVAGKWYCEPGVGFSGGLFTESASDNLTATPGGGQAGALQLTTQTSRVATVATAGDSVKLPASAAGLELVVINHGANSMQVFGAGTDTIDDVAAATGVSQMAGSVVIFTCTTAGKWYTEGLGTGYAGQYPTVSYANGITATAGGGQPGAFALTACINRVTTVATANDSVKLMPAAAGMQITVSNAAAVNSMNLFPNTGDQINALGANAAFAIPAGKTANLSSAVAGQWHAVLSA